MSRNIGWGRLSLLQTGGPQSPDGCDFASNVMHVDADAICPRCMRWISTRDIVRRTAYGLFQHEVCAVTDRPTAVSGLRR
jgi:hypothetical protein